MDKESMENIFRNYMEVKLRECKLPEKYDCLDVKHDFFEFIIAKDPVRGIIITKKFGSLVAGLDANTIMEVLAEAWTAGALYGKLNPDCVNTRKIDEPIPWIPRRTESGKEVGDALYRFKR